MPGAASADACLVSVRLHVSHHGVQEVRRRVWRQVARAPAWVAGGDIGRLDLPPAWTIWNVARSEGIAELDLYTREVVTPWLEALLSIAERPQNLIEGVVPLVPELCAFELLLVEAGLPAAFEMLKHREAQCSQARLREFAEGYLVRH